MVWQNLCVKCCTFAKRQTCREAGTQSHGPPCARWPGHRRTVIGLKRGWIQAVCILFILASVTTVGIGADISVSYTVLPFVAVSVSQGDYVPHEQALLVFPSITDVDWERGFAQRVIVIDGAP